MKGMKLLRALGALDDSDIAEAWEQPLQTEAPAPADAADIPAEPEPLKHTFLIRVLEIGGLAACAALAVGMMFLIRGMNSKIETASSGADSAYAAATTVQNEAESGSTAERHTDAVSAVTTERNATPEQTAKNTQESRTDPAQTDQTTTDPQENRTDPAQTEKTTTDPRENSTKPAQTDQTTTDPLEHSRSTEKTVQTTAESVSKPEPAAVSVAFTWDYEFPAHRIHDPESTAYMYREFFDYGRGGGFRQYRISQVNDPDLPTYARNALLAGYDVTAVYLRSNELGHQLSLMADPVVETTDYQETWLNLVVRDDDPVMAEQETCLHVLVLMTKPGVMPDLKNVLEERVYFPMHEVPETEQQRVTREILEKKLNQTAPEDIKSVWSAADILPRLHYCLGPNDVTFLCDLDPAYPVEYLVGADHKAPYCIYRLEDGGSLVLYFNENPNSLWNVSYAFVVYDLLQKEDFAELKPGMTLEDVERIDAGEKLIHTYNLYSVSRNLTLHMVEGGFIKIEYTGAEMQFYMDRKVENDEIIIKSVEFIPNGSNLGAIDPLYEEAHFDVRPGDYGVITGT